MSITTRTKKPLPLARASKQELSKIRGVCFDIDDTLSTRGKLTASAYQALWDLRSKGYALVALTGRPAGWCDLIARFWPVDAVVGENGAFTFFVQDGKRGRIDTPDPTAPSSAEREARMKNLRSRILKRFPSARWASDQAYREYDLAIDFCEDVPAWPKADVRELVRLCEDEGAHAKVSSIHVNAWFGQYDKFSGFRHWLGQGAPGLKKRAPVLENWVFAGDSPNDEPLFKAFRYSVGVANLKRFLPDLQVVPTWITHSVSGVGFGELTQALIRSRK